MIAALATAAAIAVVPLWLMEISWAIHDGAILEADLPLFALFDLGILLVAATAVGALQGVVVRGVSAASRRLEAWRGSAASWEAFAYTLLSTPVAAYLASELFQGRRAQALPAHHLIAAGTGLLMVALMAVAIRLVLRVRSVAPRLHAAWAAALVIGLFAWAALAVWVDRYVRVRLYAPFHAALAGGAFLVAELAVGVIALRRPLTGRMPLYALGLLAAGISAASVGWGEERLRAATLERAALGGKILAASPHRRVVEQAPEPAPVQHDGPPLPLGPRVPGRDIVLITVDALRADRLGALGYRRQITPNLDRLAAASTLFTRAYCQVPHTSFSIATLLTGQYVHTRAALGLPTHVETMPGVLRRFGYKTAGFFPPAVFFIDREQFHEYEQQRYDFEYVKFEYLDAQRRTDQVLSFLKEERPERLFVWVHYFEPHEPYVRHPEFDFGASAPDRYDSEVALTDHEIGRLIEAVDRARPGAIVAVTADHGEEFGDHGGHYHGRTLYDEQIRVPLMIRVPGLAARHVDRPVETVDLAPTLLALVDIPPPTGMLGTDLGPWIGGADPDRLPAAYAEVFTQKMAARGHMKLVVDSRANVTKLFDLEADPGERRNLVDVQAHRVAELRAEIEGRLNAISDTDARPSRETAIQRGRAGDPFAVDALMGVLEDGDPELRREAAKLLFDLAGESVIADLGRYLDDGDPEVAHRIALVAARLGLPLAADRVRRLMQRPDLPSSMRRQAALALAEQGAGDGLEVLLDSAGPDRAFWERRAVVMALGSLGDRRATPTLLGLLDDVRMCRLAVTALGRIGDRRAVGPLLDLVEHSRYISVRETAARALLEIGDRRSCGKLKALLPREPEPPVVAAILVTLAALNDLPRASNRGAERWLVLSAERPGSARVRTGDVELALIDVNAGLGAYRIENVPPAARLVVSGATLVGSWAP